MDVLQHHSSYLLGQAEWQKMTHFWDYNQLRPRDGVRQGNAVLYRETRIVLAVDDQGWHFDSTEPLRAAGRANGCQNMIDRSRGGLCPRP